MKVTTHGTSDRLPDFFIAGAPKTGTTSLYHYLNQHPQIYMSPVKEPCYFASEVRSTSFAKEFRPAAEKSGEKLRALLDQPGSGGNLEGIVSEWTDYLKLFRSASTGLAAGEASVCYLWSRTAAANIQSKIPDAKVIMILRDPSERAFSQYLHNAADGVAMGTFREQVEQSMRNRRQEFNPLYPFLENGLYHEQVKRYLDLFPRDSIRIYIYEEAWRDPLALMSSVFGFLKVDSDFVPNLSRRSLQSRAPRSTTAHTLLRKSGLGQGLRKILPAALRSRARTLLFKPRGSLAMEARDRHFLRDYYRDDVVKLARLIDRDLNIWLE